MSKRDITEARTQVREARRRLVEARSWEDVRDAVLEAIDAIDANTDAIDDVIEDNRRSRE